MRKYFFARQGMKKCKLLNRSRMGCYTMQGIGEYFQHEQTSFVSRKADGMLAEKDELRLAN